MNIGLNDFEDWFRLLELQAGDNVFVHSSAGRLGQSVQDAMRLISALKARLGKAGTIFMPSYIWRGAQGKPPTGAIFDVRRTPSQVGLISEVFRRTSGTIRSESYWVPICGNGPLAFDVLSAQDEVTHSFAKGSSFRNLLDIKVKLLGLGVSLNTSSLAHLPDYDLEHGYPVKVFDDEPLYGKVVTIDGKEKLVSVIIVKPFVMERYKPSALFHESEPLKAVTKSFQIGNNVFFSYPVEVFYSEGLRIGQQNLSLGVLPPWLFL